MTTVPIPPIRVALLVPVYGVERYIEACARSLFEQSYPYIDYIFVDDASPDRSIARLEATAARYPERMPYVRILRHPRNRGLAAARTTALEAAAAPYVLHVDSDDRLVPDAVERLVEATSGGRADWVTCDYAECDDRGGSRIRRLPAPDRERMLRTLLAQSHRIPNRIWGQLIRRTLYTDHGIRPVEGVDFAEDYSVLPRLLCHAARIARVARPLYLYRTANTASFMNNLSPRSADSYVEANRIVTRYIRNLPDGDRWRRALLLGKLNIGKWILMRGFDPERWAGRLFADTPIEGCSCRLYRAILRTRCLTAARAMAAWMNLFHG